MALAAGFFLTWCVVDFPAFLQGVLRICVFFAWYFAGEVVVICVVNVVSQQRVFWWLKVRHRIELYFRGGLPEKPFLSEPIPKNNGRSVLARSIFRICQ